MKYILNQKIDKKLLYMWFFILELVKLAILRIYIKINLDNSFIYSLKYSTSISIFLILESSDSF